MAVNIPKILHLYWGGGAMSWLQTLTVFSFHRLNPDWSIRIYTPTKPNKINAKYSIPYTGISYFHWLLKLDYVNVIPINMEEFGLNLHMHEILRSDIFRYMMLYQYGGVWSDFDVLWQRPISELDKISIIGDCKIEDMGISLCKYNNTTGFSSIGVLFATQGHLFYRELIEKCWEVINNFDGSLDQLKHQVFGANLWDRLYPTFDDILKKYPDCIAFPYKTFYPYSLYEIDLLYQEPILDKVGEAMAVHWFNGHKLSKEYMNDRMGAPCMMEILTKTYNQ